VYAPPEDARFKLPEVFRNKLLMADWTRDVIAAVEVTAEGQLGAVTRLLPWESFRRPIDLDVGPDGALYVLEYGSSIGGDIDSREANPPYTYESPGLHRVSLTIVTSAGGRSLPSSTNIVVGNTPPVVELLSPEDNITVDIGSVVELRGTVSDLQDAGIDCSKLARCTPSCPREVEAIVHYAIPE
jgi:hypothetical protein